MSCRGRVEKRGRKNLEGSGDGHDLNQNDFIGRLPEDILLNILNKLPTEDAVATSLISRAWKDLWKLSSTVDFNFRWVQVRGKEIQPSVNQFLHHHRGREIKRFAVSCRLPKSMVPDVQSWITFAVNKNVEELYINLNDREDNRRMKMNRHRQFCFPTNSENLNFSSLLKLTLKSTRLDMKYFPLCNSLQELNLEELQLSDEDINGITEKSPVLQLLRFVNCNTAGSFRINISPDSDLRNLIIVDEFMDYNRDLSVHIDAPKIKRIEFLSGMPRKTYEIVQIGFEIEAKLDFTIMSRKLGAVQATCNGLVTPLYEQNFVYLIKKFQTVKLLELSSWCIQVLSILKAMHEDNLLFEVTHLVLNTGLSTWELPGIALLLRACPNLENLVIVINDHAEDLEFNHAFRRKHAFKQEDFWNNQSESFTNSLQQLVVVEFRISRDKIFRDTVGKGIAELETWENNSIEEQFFSQDTIRGYSAGAELLKFLRSKSINLAKLIFTTKRQKFRICLKEIQPYISNSMPDLIRHCR